MKNLLLIFTFVLMFAIRSEAADLQASVNNNQIPYGEAFVLTISDNTAKSDAQPDLSVLQRDFTIYSTSSSLQSSYSNGVSKQKKEWHITLLPHREGKITIPAINVGNYATNSLEIEILPSGSITAKKNTLSKQQTNEDTFAAELSVNDKNPYVQQEVNAVLTIYDNRGLQIKQEPTFNNNDDWIIKLVGQPEIIERGNARLIKFFYAMFPQKSGTLQIPSAEIDGVYFDMDNPQNVNNDFFGFRINLGGMFGVEKPVKLHTESFPIEVKSAPKEYGDEWWLPAQKIVLSAKWSDNKKEFKVDETAAREITIAAAGITETQLPELNFAENSAWKQYPEAPETSSTIDGNNVISQATYRIVYIPQQSGKMILPAIKVKWFDVKNGKIAYATIPEEIIIVQGNKKSDEIITEAITEKASALPDISGKNKTAANDVSKTQSEDKSVWLYILVAFVAGLLFSYIAFGKKNKQTVQEKNVGLHEISSAIRKNDYRSLRDALLRWGKENITSKRLNNLQDLADFLQYPDFSNEMEKLNSIIYAGKTTELNYEIIVNTLKKYKKNKDNIKDDPLPKLYK